MADLANLSSCSRTWRQLSLPLLFQRVTFLSGLPNEIATRFLAYNALLHGHLIKEIKIDIFPPDDYLEGFKHARWGGLRDGLFAAIISVAPNISSVHICFGVYDVASALPNPLPETVRALYDIGSLRRLVLDQVPADDDIFRYITTNGYKLDSLVIRGVFEVTFLPTQTLWLGSSTPHFRSLALSYINVGALLKIYSFPYLTHLHLNVYSPMTSTLPTLFAVQDTLLYLSLEGNCEPDPDETPPLSLPEVLTLPRLRFLRLMWFESPNQSITSSTIYSFQMRLSLPPTLSTCYHLFWMTGHFLVCTVYRYATATKNATISHLLVNLWTYVLDGELWWTNPLT